ncbi:MAG TPA: sigma-70 family RNA polymerase sigma factor [Bryobacteraceae bacterium]|jgi:RNA polymerase sigma-70 factor (ECF subfamily)|nr:sigma-70 family RNA polymerase sigma factor [Bryobacteraceae bacterium]
MPAGLDVATSLPAPPPFGLFRDDSDLIPKLKKREPEALGDVYDRYGLLTFALILHIVKDRAIAEEILAASFLVLWNRIQRYPYNRGSLGLWLLAIARDRAVHRLRAGESWYTLPNRVCAENTPSLFIETRVQEHAPEEIRRLRNAFVQCKEIFCILLELAYFEGLSVSELAARLDEPVETVEAWLRTALDGLHP